MLPAGQNTEYGSPDSTYTVSNVTYDRRSGNPIPNTLTVNRRTGESLPDSTGDGNPPITPAPVAPPLVEEERSRLNPNQNVRTSRRSSSKPSENTILRYPYSALTQETDYLQIDIVDYTSLGQRNALRNKRQNKEVGKFQGLIRDFTNPNDRGRQITSNPLNVSNSAEQLSKRSIVRKGTIILPMPENIVDGNTVSYADSSMNALTAIGLASGIDFMQDIGDQLFSGKPADEILRSAAQKFASAGGNLAGSVGNADGMQDLITKKLATMLVGQFGGNVTVQQLLAREDGVIFNPNKELLFNGVNLRNFNFQFKFIPRNKNESIQVEKIIKSFKRNMAPVVAGSGQGFGFLNTPSVFELRYRKGHSEHPFLHKFKQCFLENCTVNYTGDGFYTTYSDGTPVSTLLNLSFKEIEPIYDIDYDNSGLGVGY
tara:strand:+ start:57 stop:1340 length:1284 start_codon:yes stop_codon:yes gene_type:complete